MGKQQAPTKTAFIWEEQLFIDDTPLSHSVALSSVLSAQQVRVGLVPTARDKQWKNGAITRWLLGRTDASLLLRRHVWCMSRRDACAGR